MSTLQLPLWVTVPGTLLLIFAGFMALVGSIGLLRLPDFFSRMHGPSITNTMGLGATLTASLLVGSALEGRPVIHEVLIIILVLATAPITSMMLVQAALYRNRARGTADNDSPPQGEATNQTSQARDDR